MRRSQPPRRAQINIAGRVYGDAVWHKPEGEPEKLIPRFSTRRGRQVALYLADTSRHNQIRKNADGSAAKHRELARAYGQIQIGLMMPAPPAGGITCLRLCVSVRLAYRLSKAVAKCPVLSA